MSFSEPYIFSAFVVAVVLNVGVPVAPVQSMLLQVAAATSMVTILPAVVNEFASKNTLLKGPGIHPPAEGPPLVSDQ